MAITTASFFTVRTITEDGEFCSQTEPMDESEALATFDDTVENSGESIFVQMIGEDGAVSTEARGQLSED